MGAFDVDLLGHSRREVVASRRRDIETAERPRDGLVRRTAHEPQGSVVELTRFGERFVNAACFAVDKFLEAVLAD